MLQHCTNLACPTVRNTELLLSFLTLFGRVLTGLHISCCSLFEREAKGIRCVRNISLFILVDLSCRCTGSDMMSWSHGCSVTHAASGALLLAAC